MASDDLQPELEEPSQWHVRRTWPQRLLIAAAFVAAFTAFAAAGGILFAQRQLENRNLVRIESGASATGDADALEANGPLDATTDDGGDGGETAEAPAETPPVETFPLAEPGARNFLITGADNNSCIDPDSPYAPAFGDRGEAFGARSDTIMMWRVNPSTSQVAVLSFPRDLWVAIDGRSGKSRINGAYQRDDPQRLINTIYQNFGIETDHFVQIDFCAFKILVDAVDGVAVPFDFPVRDVKTGLNVPSAGCFNFDGDHALAYVRSRSLQYLDEDGQWQTDPTSDLGRISRQQDFIRRVADELLANRFSPEVIRGLLETSAEYVVTDTGLTPDKVLEFAGVLQSVEPAEITTYQVEWRRSIESGNDVLIPRLDTANMQAILAVFRGEATLADRPEQVFDDTTSAPETTVPLTTVDPADTGTPTTTEALPFEPLPEVEIDEDVFGIVPDGDVTCS
jgi:LCP family protein required for cell wall assembly